MRWLAGTQALQRDVYGIEPSDDPAVQAAAVKDNVLAGIVELVEVLNEVTWKPWAHDAPQVHRQEVLEEAVDAMHFIGNILVAIGVTDEEFEEAYLSKQAINRIRQRINYSQFKS